MIVEQIKLSMMDIFCYIIGDEVSGTCALIDPASESENILSIVESKGLRVSFVINTHAHADHTSGNHAIIKKTGARLLIHEDEAHRLTSIPNKVFARFLKGKGSPPPDILLKDDFIVNIGETPLKVLHTPGHSPGSICLSGNGNLFTGDTLFVGGVGRTDLPGGSPKTLLNSIKSKLYTLPDETVVWPGHDYGVAPSSTILREKTSNPFTLG